MGSSNCRNWETDKVKNLIKSKRNGIYKKKEFHGRGVRIVNMGELFEYDFISDQKMELIELNEKEKNKFLLEDGDLLFARRSLVLEGSGKCSLVVNPNDDITFESSIIRLRPNKEIADPKFYFYYFSSPKGRSKVMSIASQTAVSGIRSSDLIELEVDVPPLNKQKQIASKLTSFDRLTKNNSRRIEILEEMARRIYREWFVHFRYPGHEDDELVDSDTELGEIPEGWEMKRLEDFGEIVLGKTPSTKDSANYGNYMPFIKTPDMHDQFFIHETENVLSKKGVETQKKKTLPADSICVSCIGTAGVVAITSVPSQTNQQINSIVPEDKALREYLYFTTKALKPLMEKIGSTGATMTNVSKTKFKGLPALSAPEDVVNKFHAKVGPLFDQISTLQKQNDRLKETRDLLLPKLISGKIDVEEMELAI